MSRRDYSIYPCCFSTEHRRRLSKANKGKNLGKRSSRLGKKLSLITKQRVSKSLTRFFQNHPEARQKIRKALTGKKRSLATCQKISKSLTEFFQNHPEVQCGRGKQGWFFSKKNRGIWLHYRSLWEKNWYQLLEKLDKVKGYWVEPVVIEYSWDGGTHCYLPDLLVFYIDGTRDLVEIKPRYRRKDSRNQAKFKAARTWCARCHRYPTSFKVVGKGRG